MEISGKTVLTGLLGSPVAHSISPAMHNAAFQELGLDYVYLAFDVNREGLADAAALHLDDDALEVLKALVSAFHDLHVHPDLIADLELRQIGTQLFFFQFLDDVGHFDFLLSFSMSDTGVHDRKKQDSGPSIAATGVL